MTIDINTLFSDYESLSSDISTIVGLNKNIFDTEDEERLLLEIRQLVTEIKNYYPAKKLLAINAESIKLIAAFANAETTLRKSSPDDANAIATLNSIKACTDFVDTNTTLLKDDPIDYIRHFSRYVQNIHAAIGDHFPGVDDIIRVRKLCNNIFNMISGIENSLDSLQLIAIFQNLVVANKKLEAFKDKLKKYQKVISTATSVILKIIEIIDTAKQILPFLAL